MSLFWAALTLQAGYNTALVTIGAAILGASAAAVGAFVLLRKRSLVSDAISHATLPGLVLAFIAMALLWGDGRWIPGLLIGATVSAGLGLLAVEWMARRTRLSEDAAIGAVLSAFFGFGVVLLTVVQSLNTGGQAGLSGFLVGSTASMLRSEAETIAISAALIGLAVFALRRPFTLVAFDPGYAATRGLSLRATDLALMALTLLVTVVGLRVAGLVLIVALTIIPPVAARFWTDRPGRMVAIAAAIGALSAYVGTVLSALDANMPTGALIVLVSFAVFLASLVFSPLRGLLAGRSEARGLARSILIRQGLLDIATGRRPEAASLTALRRSGFLDEGGEPTAEGRRAAEDAARDERLRAIHRRACPAEARGLDLDLRPLADLLGPERIGELERLGGRSA